VKEERTMSTTVTRVRAAYDRVEAVDRPEIWIDLRPREEVEREAAAIDERLARGEQLPLAGLPLVAGGRSSGARVACRTAAATGAAAVLCLAFPLHPPGRPEKSRLDELDAVSVPVLVVQGERDPFGLPPPGPNRTVVTIPGSHSLRSPINVTTAVSEWLAATVIA